jgi:hypothetical protein
VHRKALLLLPLLLPALAVAAILFTRPPPELTYDGRSLESWVSFDRPYGNRQSQKAITTIVTNCLPSLIQKLKYDPMPRRARVTAIAKCLPKPLLRKQRIMRLISIDEKDRRATIAFRALCIAGPAARAAVPDLRQMAINTNSLPSTRAIQALILIDDDPAATLAAIVLNPNHPGRRLALDAAWASPSRTIAPELIDILVQTVTNSNEEIACVAISAVGELACRNLNSSIDVFIQETDLLVPTLQQATHDPRERVSQAAKDQLNTLATQRREHLPNI